jgi:Coenzyme PQQ synthesis protein D (PqqD)
MPVRAYRLRQVYCDKITYSFVLLGEIMPPKIKPDVTVQQVGDEALVLDLQSGQIHQLNATAAWILSQCNGENSIEAITRDFAACFSLDAGTAERDVTTTIEQFNQANVIELD